jgi:hypothetical protein
MLTVKFPLHFLGTSRGKIMTHAYWRKCNTVMWNKKYQSDITALSATLWNFWVASNCTVSIVTDCRLNDQGSVPGTGKGHPLASVSTPALRPTQYPIQQEPLVVRGRGCDADVSPPSSAEVKYESFPPCRLRGGIGTALLCFCKE